MCELREGLMFEVGDIAYLAKKIIEPACGDRPQLLMGRKGERVEIREINESDEYKYTVEGPTNEGKPWRAKSKDLMRTKPMRFNWHITFSSKA